MYRSAARNRPGAGAAGGGELGTSRVARIPAFELPRNEPRPRAPRYRTEAKWMHDGMLAPLARMEEPEPVVAREGGRDSA
jgi:hypothetical protein